MSKKQMQDDAMDAMRTGKDGYFWMDDDINSVEKKSIFVVLNPSSRIIYFKYEFNGIPYDNFSFTDPRPREAPPKYQAIMVLPKNTQPTDRMVLMPWCVAISEGFVNDAWQQWRPLDKDGTVPEDLR